MNESNIQADLLETARSLILRDPDGFSVAALCRETGLSRSKMRQYFPTKAALMTALLEQDQSDDLSTGISDIESDRTAAPAEIIGESWIERRFRVFERALALLENRTEGATAEQSRALAMIEERLSGPVSASLAELPPIVAMKPQPVAAPVTESGAVPENPPKTEPVVISPLDFFPPAPAFHARKKLQTILENAPAAADVAQEKQKFLEEVPPWLLVCAGLAGCGAAAERIAGLVQCAQCAQAGRPTGAGCHRRTTCRRRAKTLGPTEL